MKKTKISYKSGDFKSDSSLIWMSLISIGIGILCSFVAVILLKLIAFFTNLFYFHHLSTALNSPAENQLGWIAIFVPVLGGLIVGLMARFGSERIRGHGIPEALEAILFSKSRMQPKVAILKPVASAIAIGSGGPFGAEGPIIMTGGAFGSLIAQIFKLTSAERKTLLVAGAAAGMSATFATPIAAVLLAVELLLFEWKPRSLIPVALASAVAATMRVYVLGAGPLFPVPPHAPIAITGLLFAALCGLLGGIFASLLTKSLYKFEDLFHKLPFHWMWWPALGGLAIGIGGYFEPHALGIGYDLIGNFLKGDYIPAQVMPLITVKAIIWCIALSSGTSGGVLAPLLIMGSGLGAIESLYFLGGSHALWPLISMAAVLAGVIGAPLTAVLFALELTHDINSLLPVLVASMISYAVTVLFMKRSILTEKIARRGFHIFREYSVDLLEMAHVEDVMTKTVVSIPDDLPIKDLLNNYFGGHHKGRGYPVIDKDKKLAGVITITDILKHTTLEDIQDLKTIDLIEKEPIVAYPHESCRTAAIRMANFEIGRMPVVSLEEPTKVVGIITRSDLLKPSIGYSNEENLRERFFSLKK